MYIRTCETLGYELVDHVGTKVFEGKHKHKKSKELIDEKMKGIINGRNVQKQEGKKLKDK